MVIYYASMHAAGVPLPWKIFFIALVVATQYVGGRMSVLGLTGGIACGKSTVADMLRRLDYKIVDADKIAHEIM